MKWHRTAASGRPDRAPFALIVAITACGTLGMHLIIPALPETARALGVSAGAIQLTITLYLIGLAIGQLLYGPISDRFGRRPVLLAGLALFTLAGIATTARRAPGRWWSHASCSRSARAPAWCWDGRSCAILRQPIARRRSSHADAGDVRRARDRAGAGRLCHRLVRLARRLRAAGDHRRGDAGAAVLLLPETNALQSSSRASHAAWLAAAVPLARVLRLRAGRGVHHHVVLRLHGRLAVHPGGPAAPVRPSASGCTTCC